jgi:hypothetical protein
MKQPSQAHLVGDERLTGEQLRARERLLKLIQEQGARPLSVDELDAMGDVWPEDESVDEFLAWREERRRASRQERIP